MLKRSFAAVVPMICVANMASAECAWVLWAKETNIANGKVLRTNWELLDAFEDRMACIQAGVEHLQEIKKLFAEQKNAVAPGIIRGQQESVGTLIVGFLPPEPDGTAGRQYKVLCLPETFTDPSKF